MFLGPPSAPDGPMKVLRITRNSVVIQWAPPLDNGGCQLTRYKIEFKDSYTSLWKDGGFVEPEMTTTCITDLRENCMYHFRVFAENAYGLGDPLEMDIPVIPKRIYG